MVTQKNQDDPVHFFLVKMSGINIWYVLDLIDSGHWSNLQYIYNKWLHYHTTKQKLFSEKCPDVERGFLSSLMLDILLYTVDSCPILGNREFFNCIFPSLKFFFYPYGPVLPSNTVTKLLGASFLWGMDALTHALVLHSTVTFG